MQAVCCPLTRTDAFPKWAAAVRELRVPEDTAFFFLDRYWGDAYDVRQELAVLVHDLRARKHLVAVAVNPQEPVDGMRRRHAIAQSFNLLTAKALAVNPEAVWFWEDDIVAPPDAMERLLADYRAMPEADMVAATQYGRWGSPCLLAWGISRERVFPPGDACNDTVLRLWQLPPARERTAGTEAVGACATGFCAFRPAFLRKHRFTATQAAGHDLAAGKTICALGRKVIVNWGVKTGHLAPDGKEWRSSGGHASAPTVVQWPERVADTALVIAYTYENEIRHQAAVTAIQKLATLRPMPIVVACEIAFPGRGEATELRAIVEATGGHYMAIAGTEDHRNVFNKEAQYNYVIRRLPPEVRVIVTLDADTYPTDRHWIGNTRAAVLKHGDGTIFQPWSSYNDTKDKGLAGESMACRYSRSGILQPYAGNPGLAIAMTRGCWESIGGFPTSCPCGAGDNMLMMEVCGGKYLVGYAPDFPYFSTAYRTVPTKAVRHVQCYMVHCHHGAVKARGYRTRHQLLQAFWPWKDLYIDENGLIAIKAGSTMAKVLARRRECATTADVCRLLAECGHHVPVWTSKVDYNQTAKHQPAYWTSARWLYMKAARNMLETRTNGRLLEVGAYTIPLAQNSVHMDLWGNGVPATIHDAGIAPWPFATRSLGAVVALQVVEHVEDKRTFFAEAGRVAPWVCVSLPWRWPHGVEKGHDGIDEQAVANWTGGATPVAQQETAGRRMVLLYRGDDLL